MQRKVVGIFRMVSKDLSEYWNKLYADEKEETPPKAKFDLIGCDSVVLFFSLISSIPRHIKQSIIMDGQLYCMK